MNSNQTQVNKLDQIQEQAFSYNIIGILLSSLECYTNQFIKHNQNKTNLFSAYNNFNCGNTKTKLQLKHQIITQLESLKASLSLYISNFGEYEFPKSMPKDKMISHINKWKENIPEEDHKYFDTAIDILNNKEVSSFINEFGEQQSINPNFLMANTGIIYESQKTGPDAVIAFQKEGIVPDLIVGSDKVGNEKINERGKAQFERIDKIKELDKLLDDIIQNIILIGDNDTQKKEKPNHIRKYKELANAFIQKCEEFNKVYTFYWYKDNKISHNSKITMIKFTYEEIGNIVLEPSFDKILELLKENQDYK